jgi:alpha-tubulin suppressor-like RCC1 family protein
MVAYFKRIFRLYVLIIIPQLIAIFILISCSSPTEPELPPDDEFLGQLEADIDHAILKPDGAVWAWGGNSTGQLGDGTMNPSAVPVQVKNLKDVVAIDFLEGAAVAADKRGDIWFWGNRLIWSEGTYDTIVTEPKKISHLYGVISLEIKGIYINMLRKDGTVWRLTWDHMSPTKYLEPEKIPEMVGICQISGDLALKSNGTLCAYPDRLVLQPEEAGLIDKLKNIVQLENRSRSYTIILKEDSTVWAWGKNSCGTLGNGSYEDSPIPIRINNLDHIAAISVNGAMCLALKSDGTVWFWGLSYLNLDQNIKIYQNVPVKIDGLKDVQLIKAGGGNRNIVMKADGTYWVFDSINRIPEKVPFN